MPVWTGRAGFHQKKRFLFHTTHEIIDLSYAFAKKCKFDLVQVDGYSAYAYSDEQMAIFTYTEGDIYLTLFTDKTKYEAEKERTIKFYEEEY